MQLSWFKTTSKSAYGFLQIPNLQIRRKLQRRLAIYTHKGILRPGDLGSSWSRLITILLYSKITHAPRGVTTTGWKKINLQSRSWLIPLLEQIYNYHIKAVTWQHRAREKADWYFYSNLVPFGVFNFKLRGHEINGLKSGFWKRNGKMIAFNMGIASLKLLMCSCMYMPTDVEMCYWQACSEKCWFKEFWSYSGHIWQRELKQKNLRKNVLQHMQF